MLLPVRALLVRLSLPVVLKLLLLEQLDEREEHEGDEAARDEADSVTFAFLAARWQLDVANFFAQFWVHVATFARA